MLRRFLLPFLLLCANLHAATFDNSLLTSLHWRMIGPFRGGRVLAITGVRGQPQHFYFGAVNGGVWETVDAGRTWQPIFDQMPVASIGAIAVAPSDPNVIYVGSGEADMRSDIGYGNGMYKSTNAGKTWTRIGLEDSHQIGRILINPKEPNDVYVAVLGHAYGPNPERGVFRSKDGGVTWRKILYKDADTGAIDLAFGENVKTIYAALWQTRRPPWNVYPPSYGPGTGLYKSKDGGETWKQITSHGFPSEGLGRIGIAVVPAKQEIVYALVDAKEGGLYRSDDAGANWKRVSEEKRIWQRGWYFGGVTVDPKNPDIVYVCNTAMYKSTDGGKTMQSFRGAPGGDDYHSLWIDPDDSNRMISGVDQGAIITVNGGDTWSSWYNQPIGQFYHAITDNSYPYLVYGAQQDSGAAAVPSRADAPYDGINMTQFHEVTAGDENGYIAPDPLNPQIIYGNAVERLDRRTEQTSEVDPTFAYPDIYRSEWTLPLTFSPRNPHLLYFGNQFLFRTSDEGKHWSLLSGDMTRKKLSIPPNLDPVTANDSASPGERRAVIYAIAPSPIRDHLIWIGTDDGLVWITEDEGAQWRDVTPSALTPWSKVGVIVASHFDARTAYIAIDRHRIDDYAPYIYRTFDQGKSWTPIMNGIPAGHFVNVVREDPEKKGLLYAGTELGMFVSFDDGDHWQSLQLNLPTISIRDIDVHENDLVIGTHGRAFWIMDNITPLRQMHPENLHEEAWLLKPATADRIHIPAFIGTPLPKDEPIAENPSFGAIIDYYLKNDMPAPVNLDIVSSSGETVRHYSSADTPRKYDFTKIVIAPNWLPQPQILSAKSGMHRFVWDLHYALPEQLFDEESKDGTWPSGRWALPGRYVVKLTANGHTYTQSLIVRNDPRVKVSQADLVRQSDFAKRIEIQRVHLADVSKQIKDLLKRVEAMNPKASASITEKLQSFENEVTALTELHTIFFDPGMPAGFPTKVDSFLYLQNRFSALQRTVDQADGSPSPDALVGFDKLTAKLKEMIQKWEEFKARRLPQLNEALKQENLPPL